MSTLTKYAYRIAPRTPRQASLAAFAVAAFLVIVRAIVLGGVGHFVVAGDNFVDPAKVPGDIPVEAGSGYDGQFFYRLTLDPFHLGVGSHDGITFDNAFRGGRIAYPLLAWVVSLGGQPSLAAVGMVIVNLLAIGVLGFVGAKLAIDSGRSAAWGLLLAGYFGYSFSLSRDLAEVLAAAAICTALLLVRRRCYWCASAALAVAVLTREQSVLSVAVLTVGVLLFERRNGWRTALTSAAQLALAPATVFIAWQMIAATQLDRWPALVSTEANGKSPTFGVFSRLGDFASEALGSGGARFSLLLFLALVVLVVGAAVSGAVRESWRQHPGELLLGVYAVVLAVRFYGLTIDPAYYRQAYEIAIVAWLIMFAGRRRVAVTVASMIVPVTAVVTVYRMLHV